MKNEWKNLWSNRSADQNILQNGDKKQIFLELKRSNGYDVMGELSYEAFIENYYYETRDNLSCFDANIYAPIQLQSVYEVGCGSGANLYLFEQDGISCGGIDYSTNLISSARQVLYTADLCCGEAKDISVTPQYNSVLSDGVFCYFKDKLYARQVMEKMCEKATYSVGILQIQDQKKEDEYLKYRRANIKNFDEKYKNLPK